MKLPNTHDIRRRALLSLLAALPVVSGCVPAVVGTGAATGANIAVDRRTTGTVVEDQAIEWKAAKLFYSDQDIRDQTHINVVSYNNVVLLTGEATNAAVRDRAVELVRDIQKVRHIHNEIIIAAPSSLLSRSSDTVITGEIKSRLLVNENVRGQAVKVVTENGTVFLMGLVGDAEAQVATAVAQEVGGVQTVVTLFEKAGQTK